VDVSFATRSPVNVTRMVLAVNPVIGPTPDAGIVLASGTRLTNRTLCSSMGACKSSAVLDTSLLCNGVHRLVLRAESYAQAPPERPQFGSGTMSSSLMVPFAVNNAVQSNESGDDSSGDVVGCRMPAAAARRAAAPAAVARAVAAGDSGTVARAAAANRAWRAARRSPQLVVMAASPRVVQELEVAEYHTGGV
jgi:hypothetical protein